MKSIGLFCLWIICTIIVIFIICKIFPYFPFIALTIGAIYLIYTHGTKFFTDFNNLD